MTRSAMGMVRQAHIDSCYGDVRRVVVACQSIPSLPACLPYRNGVFFFQTLYSSFTNRSSTSSGYSSSSRPTIPLLNR